MPMPEETSEPMQIPLEDEPPREDRKAPEPLFETTNVERRPAMKPQTASQQKPAKSKQKNAGKATL